MLHRFYRHWLASYSGIPRAIWFLSLVNLINRCGGMVISFLTLYLTQELGFDIRQAGYVMGFFGLGALAGAFIGGKLTDRFGYFGVQFWSLLLNGAMLLLLLLVRDFWTMCAAVFTMSLMSEMFRPANSVAIARHSDAATQTRSVSLYRMSANLGWTVAPAFGGILVAVAGWPALFWVDGLTCMGAALMLVWKMPRKASTEPAPTGAQAGGEAAASTTSDNPYRDRTFLWFTGLTLLGAIVFMQLLWTVPVFFKEVYHWTEAQIGMMVAMNGLVVFLVEMPLVFRIDGRRSQLAHVRTGLILYAAAYACFLLPFGPVWVALAYIIAISVGEIFVMPFSSNYVYQRSWGQKQGQYMALYTMAYSVANIIAPLFGTQIIAVWGYGTLWAWVAGLALAVWLGMGRLARKTEVREALVGEKADRKEQMEPIV
jgi:predicted MFS family arabinose efflux permease